MRLIDADKLEAYGTTVPKECNAEDYLSGVRDVLEHIDSMPTVDAVPVEWIEADIEESAFSGYDMHAYEVATMLEEWKEKGNRNERSCM